MTTDIQPTSASTTADHKAAPPPPFGVRLKAAREALGLDRREAAQKLHLSEKVILMMEKDRYPVDLPVTFIRGYLRAYSKLLQIPDYEVKKGIEPIKQKPVPNIGVASTKNFEPLEKPSSLMPFISFFVLITISGLFGIWWYTYGTQSPFRSITKNQAGVDASQKRGGVLPVSDAANPPSSSDETKNIHNPETLPNATSAAASTSAAAAASEKKLPTANTGDSTREQATKGVLANPYEHEVNAYKKTPPSANAHDSENNNDNENDSDYSDNENPE